MFVFGFANEYELNLFLYSYIVKTTGYVVGLDYWWEGYCCGYKCVFVIVFVEMTVYDDGLMGSNYFIGVVL
jgi:hypothetical protein